jgi:hypothetical protein
MKTRIAIILIFCFLAAPAFLFAQYQNQNNQDNQNNVPPGKEMVNIGGVERVASKDALITQEGSVTSIETFRSNTVRRLAVAEDRVANLEGQTAGLQNEVRELKAQLADEKKAREALEQKVQEPEDNVK